MVLCQKMEHRREKGTVEKKMNHKMASKGGKETRKRVAEGGKGGCYVTPERLGSKKSQAPEVPGKRTMGDTLESEGGITSMASPFFPGEKGEKGRGPSPQFGPVACPVEMAGPPRLGGDGEKKEQLRKARGLGEKTKKQGQ